MLFQSDLNPVKRGPRDRDDGKRPDHDRSRGETIRPGHTKGIRGNRPDELHSGWKKNATVQAIEHEHGSPRFILCAETACGMSLQFRFFRRCKNRSCHYFTAFFVKIKYLFHIFLINVFFLYCNGRDCGGKGGRNVATCKRNEDASQEKTKDIHNKSLFQFRVDNSGPGHFPANQLDSNNQSGAPDATEKK